MHAMQKGGARILDAPRICLQQHTIQKHESQ